jgi:hypothetical protein
MKKLANAKKVGLMYKDLNTAPSYVKLNNLVKTKVAETARNKLGMEKLC